jgi:hypothetical protein
LDLIDMNNELPSTISSLPPQQIIATLKAEDGTSPSAMTAAAAAAEQRWPLLKSLTPEKWAIAPSLSETEKTHRNLIEPIETVVRKTSASAPNINVQLANALNRMNPAKAKPVEKKPIVETMAVQATTPSITIPPVPAVTTTAPVAAPMPEALSTPSPQGDSIQAILLRVEQAHKPAASPRTKVPGFLARLGKR